MDNSKVILITGTRKGVGRYLAEYYSEKGFQVIGCSRNPIDFQLPRYEHYQLDITDEDKVRQMFFDLREKYQGIDILINNAGVASMNHILLTTTETVNKIFSINFLGTFLFSREAAKLMKKRPYGRIVNLGSVATPLKLEGEAVYAASKAAVISLTQIMARELADFRVTVNAIGPTPLKTELTRGVPEEKVQKIINRQAIKRYTEFSDISNVIDFFIKEESDFITGQVVYLGGV